MYGDCPAEAALAAVTVPVVVVAVAVEGEDTWA
jgi:hypothetical protein